MAKNEAYKTVERGIERYETESGKRYRVRWKDGSGVNRSRTARTLKEARKIYAENAVARSEGKRIGRSQAVLLRDFAEGQWLEERAADREEVSLLRDLSVLDNHVLPYFGQQVMSQIDTQDIAAWKTQLQRAGVGRHTIRVAMNMMSSIMRLAAVWHRETGVTFDPVAMVSKPSGKRKTEPKIWHPIVTSRLAWILRNDSIRRDTKSDAHLQDALLVSLCSLAGLRPGEAIALKWSDIRNDKIMVNKAVSLKNIRGTKTENNRTVPILETLAFDLDELKGFRAGRSERTRYIFEKNNGSTHWDRNAYRNFAQRHLAPAVDYLAETWDDFAEAVEEAGATQVPEDVDGIRSARLYNLGRHSHSALMLSAGVPLIRLSAMQGHSIKTLSDHYSQLMEGVEGQEHSDPEEMIEEIREQVETASEAIRPPKSRRELNRKRSED